jgi:hypothetical protein
MSKDQLTYSMSGERTRLLADVLSRLPEKAHVDLSDPRNALMRVQFVRNGSLELIEEYRISGSEAWAIEGDYRARVTYEGELQKGA